MNSDDAGGSKGAATTQANPKTTELLDKNLDGINKKTGKTITNDDPADDHGNLFNLGMDSKMLGITLGLVMLLLVVIVVVLAVFVLRTRRTR